MTRQAPVMDRSKSPTIQSKSCWDGHVSAFEPERNADMKGQIRPVRFRSTALRHILGQGSVSMRCNVCAVPPRKGFGHAAIRA